MANLKRRFTFKRWAPDIGENREVPEGERLYLELAVGLTDQQLRDAMRALQTPPVEPPEAAELQKRVEAADSEGAKLAVLQELEALTIRLSIAHFDAALGAFVRVHGGPHTVDGKPLATFGDYVTLVTDSRDAGAHAMGELVAALRRFNSLEGPDELFSPRRSGGSAGTGSKSVVKEDSPTAGR